MNDWLAPAVVVGFVLGLLTLWHRSREAKLNADREVLDQILRDADEFFAQVNRLEAVLTAATAATSIEVAALSDAASTLIKVWKALESAVWRVGRLSSYRWRRPPDTSCTSSRSGSASS